MAFLFPTFQRCRFDTTGERRFAERLTEKLEDDYLCWHNARVGPMQIQPDFVIMHPRRGFLILEIKDWKIDTILTIDSTHTRLLVNGESKMVVNPLMQARHNTFKTVHMLQGDPQLVHPAEHARAGNLIAPYGWGVVLTNITRKQFNETNLRDVLEPSKVLCKDEMLESVDAEAFQQRLWNMFSHVFPCHLTLPQIDRVRFHLFPEVRINPEGGQFGLFDAQQAPIPSLLKVMDLQQEQLARSMGDGHRVIHGVAGSGKTMILGYRSMYLAQTSSKPVLVLCFNKPLAQRLTQVLQERGLAEKVQVHSFLAWCRSMLVTYNMELPPDDAEDFYAQLAVRTIKAVDQGHIPREQYSAILIDEGQDFQPDWYRLVVQMLDPSTNNLLVLYDDAQSIYGKSLEPGKDADRTTAATAPTLGKNRFSFASVGIQAQGRTTILKINYRNTLEVLSVARSFAAELLASRETGEDNVPLVAPESTGRRGAFPELLKLASEKEELHALVNRIQEAYDQGVMLADMAILCRTTRQIKDVQNALRREGIAVITASSKRGLFQATDAVKVLTLHASKGLEFTQVFIPFIGHMPREESQQEEEARLLYVGMTRATENLVMLGCKPSVFMTRIEAAIVSCQQALSLPDDALGTFGHAGH